MNSVLQTYRAEDFIEYFLYATNLQLSDNVQNLHNKLKNFIAPLIKNYIWHKDEFVLNKLTDVQSDVQENEIAGFHGITFFGENIDDEWFIIYILKKISENFDVLIRAIDSDGEFLLIEAADQLPKWMKPEICEKRVYLYNGNIRILPLAVSSESVSTKEIMASFSKNNLTNDESIITKCINQRIEKFTCDLSIFLHKRLLMIPAKVAAVLDAKPDLIAAAVAAFFHRDIIDKRIYRKMENFPPNDLVLRSVTFTKFLYAMLVHDKCKPERSKWNLPPPSDKKYQEYQLGYKITCGFEILASKYSKKSRSDLTLNKKWNQYIQVLKNKGYFKDLLEGSKEYVELEKKARLYFLENVYMEEKNQNNVLDVLETITYDVNKMKDEESAQLVSDDEKWMNIGEEEFNKLLKDRFGFQDITVNNCPNTLSSVINGFLNRVSDVEGVENCYEKTSDKLNRSEMDVDEDHIGLTFNPDEFISSVEKMLDTMELQNSDTAASENENDESDSEEYDSEDDIVSPADPVTKAYMTLMDKELSHTTLAQSFITKEKENSIDSVDIDRNVFTNILKSYEEQFGGSGPAGNLLHSMGLKLDVRKNQ